MTQGDNQGLAISLNGKQHMIACPPGQEDALLAAATKLNDELHQFKQRGQTRNDEKALLMVALNLCHQLLSIESTQKQDIQQLVNKIMRVIE